MIWQPWANQVGKKTFMIASPRNFCIKIINKFRKFASGYPLAEIQNAPRVNAYHYNNNTTMIINVRNAYRSPQGIIPCDRAAAEPINKADSISSSLNLES